MGHKRTGTGPSFNRVKKEPYYGWVIVGVLLLTGIVTLGIARFSFGVFFESLQNEFSLDRASTSGIFSLYMLLCPGITILAGWALDKYGPRKVFAAAGLFSCLGLFLTSQVTAPWQMFLTYSLLLAMGTGYFYVASMTTVSKWFTRRRGLALGIVSCGVGIGMIVMPPVAASLISSHGWRISYGILALITAVAVAPAAFLVKDSPAKEGSLSDPVGRESERGELSLAQAVKKRNFWLQMAILFLMSSSFFSVNTHIVPHALDRGIGSMEAALLMSCIGGGSLVGRIAVGRISDVAGGKRSFVICALVLVGAMLGITTSSAPWMLYLFTAIFGFTLGGTAPANVILIGENFGVAHMGLIMAVINIGWDTGAAFGPFLAGCIFDVSGSYATAFSLGTAFALLAAVLTFCLSKPGNSSVPGDDTTSF